MFKKFFTNLKHDSIYAKNVTISKLITTGDVARAYILASENLKEALQAGDDRLIGTCVFTLGRAAHEYRPSPKWKEAISSYQLAAEKAFLVGANKQYDLINRALGTAYLEATIGNREENLRNAIACYKIALRTDNERDSPQDYVKTQYNLGYAYAELTTKKRGENLKNAMECFENALRIHTKGVIPQTYEMLQHYVMLQNGLGNVYAKLSSTKQTENLQKAIFCYESALLVCSEVNFPQIYAMIQYNLGQTYLKLPVGNREKNVKAAIDCYNNALRIYTIKNYPRKYAGTQSDLGTAYLLLPTGNRKDNIRKALICYENALEVFSEQIFPQEYAMVQANLGAAYANLETRNHKKNLMSKVIACHKNALKVYTEEDYPQEYARVQIGLGGVYADLLTGDMGENLRKAIMYFENALGVSTEQYFPQEYASSQVGMGLAYSMLPGGSRLANLQTAFVSYKNALQIYTEQEFPVQYANTQRFLGITYTGVLFFKENRVKNLQYAIECFEKALKVFTAQEFPWDYAATHFNLGKTYFELSKWCQGEHLDEAIACYEKALRFFNKQDFPQSYAAAQNGLGRAYTDLKTENREENLQKAIACHKDALQVFTVEISPHDMVNALYNLALAYDTPQLNNCQKAYDICIEAIEILENHIRVTSSFENRHSLVKSYRGLYSKMVSLCIRLGRVNESINYAERAKSRSLVERFHSVRLQPSGDVPKEIREKLLSVRLKLEELHHRQQMCAQFMSPLSIFRKEPNLSNRHYSDSDKDKFFSWTAETITQKPSLNINPHKKIQQEIEGLIEDTQSEYDELLAKIYELDPGFASKERELPIKIEEMEKVVSEETILIECFIGDDATYIYIVELKEKLNLTSITLEELTIDKIEPLVREQWYVPFYAKQLIQSILQSVRMYLDSVSDEETPAEEIAEQKEQVLYGVQLIPPFVQWLEKLELDELVSDFQYIKNNIELEDFQEVAETLESFEAKFSSLWSQCFKKGWFETIEHISTQLAEKFWFAKGKEEKTLAELVKQSGAKRIVFIPHYGLHLLPLHLIPLKSHSRLIDEYEIVYAPSATLLWFVLQRERNELSHLFAVANPDSSLKYTDAEVHGIARHFETPQILWYKEATKDAVYDHAPRGHIIHFSCHGQFGKFDPLESRLLLAGDKTDEKKDLTLHDIFANLKLPNSTVVVLSACETGMVELERGDEYIGLPSGFLNADTPTVISSLWAVDDLSTALLMNRLYQKMIPKKMGKAAALRDAQLWVRNVTYKELIEYLEHASLGQHIDYKILRGFQRSVKRNPDKKPFEHPYYWAAFTCNGSWK